jgi:hypothetical protein
MGSKLAPVPTYNHFGHMSSTPETPAPLSFNDPKVRTAHEWAVTQRPYKLLTISERSALILADALTHEHEARVRAEEQREDLKNAGGPPFIRSEAIRNLKNDLDAAKSKLAKLEEEYPWRLTQDYGIIELLEKELKESKEQAEALRKALEVAQPYVVWSDPEGRSADDYPAAKAIVERDAKLVTAALAGLPAQAGVKDL